MMRAVHPGEVLSEQLEEIGMTATELARRLGVPPNRITRIVNERRAMTPDTALRLAKFFGTNGVSSGSWLSLARFWLNLQSAFDLQKAEESAEASGSLRGVKPLRGRP